MSSRGLAARNALWHTVSYVACANRNGALREGLLQAGSTPEGSHGVDEGEGVHRARDGECRRLLRQDRHILYIRHV